MSRGYADTPLGQVHYRTKGDGVPLLLLHMTPQSSRQFTRTFAPLANAGIRAIAPDLPGYGMSDAPEAPLKIEDYAAVLPHVLDRLEVDQAVIAGHHSGASIACALANAFPNRVRRVVLHGVPWYTDEERQVRLANLHVDSALRPDGSHLTDRWNWIRERVGGVASLEACHMAATEVFLTGEKEWYCHEAAFKYDMTAALTGLQQPSLVLTNTGDPLHYLVPRLTELRPDFKYCELEGGTVFYIWDDAELWVDAVVGFVKEG